MADSHSAHGHAGHTHAPAPDADRRHLSAALALLVAYMVAEIIVASLTSSLALLSDAAHMLTDAASIAVALWTIHLTAQPARGRWTYGLKRAEILSGLGNGITLLLLAAVLAVESLSRLAHPHPVSAAPMLWTTLAGIPINIMVAWLIARAGRSSLNVEGAYRHILTDLFGFIGTAVAATVILLTGWVRADAVATLVVVLLMVRAGWGLVSAAGEVLLEAAPQTADVATIREHLARLPHVRDVHDLHVWSVASNMPALSAHLVIDDECFYDGHAPALLQAALNCLHGDFDVDHSTFQLEPATHAQRERGLH